MATMTVNKPCPKYIDIKRRDTAVTKIAHAQKLVKFQYILNLKNIFFCNLQGHRRYFMGNVEVLNPKVIDKSNQTNRNEDYSFFKINGLLPCILQKVIYQQ